jgi:hypothetical protein
MVTVAGTLGSDDGNTDGNVKTQAPGCACIFFRGGHYFSLIPISAQVVF